MHAVATGSLVGVALLGVGCIGLGLRAADVVVQGQRERPSPADAAIVLGAYTDGYRPSPPLMLRLRAGLHLYRHGFARFIIVSGGQGADESIAESRSMKRFLVMNGVPAALVIEDRHSSDTRENLQNSQVLMQRMGLRTAVVVTSDYHLPRALSVARQLGMTVTGFASVSHRSEFRYAIREIFAQLLYRLHGYSGPAKG